jgi:hypothetical protein
MANSTFEVQQVELVFAPEQRDVYSYSAYEIVAPLGARPYWGTLAWKSPAINISPRWGEATKRLLHFEVEIVDAV